MAGGKGVQTRSIGHYMLHGFFIHDLGDERHQFCSLTAAAMVHGRLATRGRLERSSTAVGAISGGGPALGMAPVAVVMSVLLRPSEDSAWDARCGGLTTRVPRARGGEGGSLIGDSA
jgi:hypothetical protein